MLLSGTPRRKTEWQARLIKPGGHEHDIIARTEGENAEARARSVALARAMEFEPAQRRVVQLVEVCTIERLEDTYTHSAAASFLNPPKAMPAGDGPNGL